MKNLLLPHKAVIADIEVETPDTRTYSLRLLGSEISPSPGQFNMVGYPGVGEAPISFSSIGHNGDNGNFRHTIRSVGRVTDFLAKFAAGDEIFLRGPYGRGWPMEEARGKDLILVAGGVGLAPIRPVIETVIKKRDAFGIVTLVYGARDPLNVLFGDEFTGWSKHIRILLTVDEVPHGARWEHDTGLVTGLFQKIEFRPENTVVFICGPEIMMRFVARHPVFMGLPPSRLFVSLERRMKCGVAQCGHCQHGHTFVCKDGPVFVYKEVSRFPDGLL